MNKLLGKAMTGAIQASLWTLRRYDYYVNGSVIRLNNPDYYLDPYPVYRALREKGPILPSAANRGFIVTGFDEVKALLADKRISNDIRTNQFFVNLVRFASGDADVPLIDHPTLLNLDAPDHTRLRKLVAQGFTRQYILSLTPMIEALVDELLDVDDDAGENPDIDLIGQLARPLPAIVIATMMGVPVAERHQFEAWSQRLLGLSEIRQPALIRDAAVANTEMRAYLKKLAAEKRQHPGQDLMSQLIAAEEDGDKLDADELYSTCVLLLTAGHETTTRLIGNAIYQLMRHPEQQAAVRADRSLIDNLIEETLRYDSPVQFTVRFVKEAQTFRGKHLRRGQLLLLGLGAANHDPKVHAEPDAFDITRDHFTHLGFGHGMHLCLGMALARIEARVALNRILDCCPTLTLPDTRPDWGTNDFFRGLESLSVTLNRKRQGEN